MIVQPRRSALGIWVVLVLTLGLAVTWSLVARQELDAAIASENRKVVDDARQTFASLRTETRQGLEAACTALAQDPQLAATIATQPIAALQALLQSTQKLVGKGFVAVLSRDGRVTAHVGADAIQGLDLADARLVMMARTTLVPQSGTWIIAGMLAELSITAVRVDATIVGYIVLGQAIDRDFLAEFSTRTKVGVATAIDGKVVTSSTDIDRVAAALATQPRQQLELDGDAYLAATAEVEDVMARRPHVMFVKPLAHSQGMFERVHWIVLVVPLVVLMAVLFTVSMYRRKVVRVS